MDNIHDAVQCFLHHVHNNSHIHIIVDSDVDGYGSASMIYRYLKHINFSNVTYALHTKKQHGLSEDVENIPNDCRLVIIPDAGSNDIKQCEELYNRGVQVIVLDHHICDERNPYAIVVNNQMCEYPNKNFCGAGIVYKFLKVVDDELWLDYADEMLDINALCNISDVMDMREQETKYYAQTGLNKIRSKLFKALIEKQSYSMNGIVNITSVQFYVTPMLNALIRVGNQSDKDLLFRAFIEEDETFKYKKRGETEESDEDIYTRAARLCYNAKNRQAKEVQKSTEEIEEIIRIKQLDKDKVLFINVSDVLGETLTGLVAIKISEGHNKPCLLLRRQKLREGGGQYYGGSCRNFDYSPVESLKTFLDSTELFEFVKGHDNAAGISIKRENIPKAIKMCNEMLQDTSFEKVFRCDFDLEHEYVDVAFIKVIDDLKNIWGQGVKEPLIHIKNIPIYFGDTVLMGKELNSWKTIVGDEVAYVKFSVDKCNDMLIREYERFQNSEEEDELLGYMDVVGTAKLNNFKGILTPQIIVKDYEFKEKERR